jgi:putative ABC transport system permease protein
MKYIPLVIANLFRKKIRLVLTLGSFAVALFLFGLLAAVRAAFNLGVELAGVDRLVVINRVSLIQPLPLAYEEKLWRIRGVKEVNHQNWFGGVYQEEKNFFPQMAVEDETFRTVFPENVIPDDQWQAYMADREGAIVGADTAERFHWKLGDRIPITGTIFSGVWEFNIRAIYHGKRPDDDMTQFFFHYKYLEERENAYWKGLVGWYTVKVEDPGDSLRIAKDIDETFANSPWETRTETEKAFATGFAKEAGNIEFLITSIGSVVFFTLLLVTGNTMAIAVRERIRDLAVLKAVGFSDRFALWLVLAESLLIAAAGGALGLAGAKAFLPELARPLRDVLPSLPFSPAALAAGMGLALVIGLLAGILPALSAMRLNVVSAMRRV